VKLPILFSRPLLNLLMLSLIACGLLQLSACDSNSEPISEGSVSGHHEFFTDVTLTDQNGQKVSLASLKGKPALVDFIYTTCPGPCLVLTSRMKAIADQLGPQASSKVSFISITVDPEHDTPAGLRAYAKEQGADRAGWIFLTGSPADVERAMGALQLKRQREADGSVDHVLEFFLIGADGIAQKQYLANEVNAAKIAGDLREAASG